MEPAYFFDRYVPPTESGPGNLFLFLDFDGTLVPIQKDPKACVLSPEVKERLEALLSSGKASIAILSGRTVNDITKRIGMEGVYYGGNHGIEISGPHMQYIHPDALKGESLVNRLCREIEGAVSHIDGALVENKKFGFTVHYRSAKKEDKVLIQKVFHRIVAENADHRALSVLRGKQVLELAPDVEWDKGRAALFILGKQERRHLPVYVGDDLTDETAFKALNGQGVTVRIGKSKKSAAQYYLKGQGEVLRFLDHLRTLLQQER